VWCEPAVLCLPFSPDGKPPGLLTKIGLGKSYSCVHQVVGQSSLCFLNVTVVVWDVGAVPVPYFMLDLPTVL